MSAVIMKQEKAKKPTKTKEFTTREKEEIVDKLITARVGLLLKHPFFGNMATRLTLVDASDSISTLATDGRNFYYNNEFVKKLTIKEAEFGFAHEVLHNVFDHMGRRGSRDPNLSNIAADYAANQILKDNRIGEVPKFIKIFQNDKYRSWSYEEIYDELYKNATKIDIETLGELLDEHLEQDENTTPEERKKIRDEIKEAVISAAHAAGAGKVPGEIRRMISELTEPKMDWRQLLRMNIQSILKNNFSFSRPNRKAQHTGAVLPGLIVEDTIDVSVCVDMSGSISDKQANDFISEIKGIMDEYADFKLDLWCFDTKVYNYEQFSGDNASDILDYRVKGGGGTDFTVNWKFMKDQEIVPKKFIMFTDGYPNGDWGDSDYCDTLFVIHGNETIKAPFGQTAYYK